MTVEEAKPVLRLKMIEDGYTPGTIEKYECEWRFFADYLNKNYGDTAISEERGAEYLEIVRGIKSPFTQRGLSAHDRYRVRLIRVLIDYSAHGILVPGPYRVAEEPVALSSYLQGIHDGYCAYLSSIPLADNTVYQRKRYSRTFLEFLNQTDLTSVAEIDMTVIVPYIKTLADSGPGKRQFQATALRQFLRYLHETGMMEHDLSSCIRLPRQSPAAKIPSVWDLDDLRDMLSAIDRSDPTGKRDYAMILLAAIPGLRAGDIRNLTFSNINWTTGVLAIVQQKTKRPLSIPLPDEVLWPIIDYLSDMYNK